MSRIFPAMITNVVDTDFDDDGLLGLEQEMETYYHARYSRMTTTEDLIQSFDEQH